MEVDNAAQIIVSLYRYIHYVIREEISDLDEKALNWTPGAGTNSIATLVTHLTGSEMEALTVARGLQSERDRPSEFTAEKQTREDLLERLDLANQILEEHGQRLTEEDLSSERTRSRSPNLTTGLDTLVWNVAHAREHLGQLLLTKQLFLQPNEH